MTSLLVNRLGTRSCFAAVVLLLAALTAFGQQFPRLNGFVVDDANIFTPREKQVLYDKLDALSDTTGTQIAVYTTADLQGMEIAEYAVELGRANAVGQRDKHNGVIIVIKPKTADEKGKAYIAVGYGLEGVIPDAVAKRIVEAEMLPEFRRGDMYSGTYKAITVLSRLASGEFKASDYKPKKEKETSGAGIGALIILIIFLLIFFSGARRYGRRNNLPFWLALGLFNSIGSRHRGSWGGFSGGSGGGSFGGFGGGSFGGGGAGGEW